MLTFTEWHTEGFGVSFKIKKRLYFEKTEFQNVEILESLDFGKVLVINGEVQVAEKDEFIYHESLVHPVMMAHPSPRRVLLIGGGDGGALREILKHEIEEVTVVEIDRRIIEICKEFFPHLAKNFEDERVEVINQDGYAYVSSSNRTFDIAILDTTDPKGIAERFSSEGFYKKIKERLVEDGMVVTQLPNVILHKREASKVYSSISSIFPIHRIYFSPVPSLGGFWNFAVGSRKYHPEIAISKTRLASRFYSRDIHGALFGYGKVFEDFIK